MRRCWLLAAVITLTVIAAGCTGVHSTSCCFRGETGADPSNGSYRAWLREYGRRDLDKGEQEELLKEMEEQRKKAENGKEKNDSDETNGKEKKNGSGEEDGNGKEGDGGFEPAHIRDNAFLVEEAFNQEKGVVQHIFNWINTWDRMPGSRSRNFAATYTMELPLGSQLHQFSFTTLFLTAFVKPDGGPAEQVGDIGDTFLNYRYQLLANDDFLWSAPRFSLILPTGDERLRLGTGELGYQFNLPISRYGERFDVHFNAGYTFVPDVSLPLANGQPSRTHDLNGYNLGGSVYWKPEVYLNFFVEVLWLWIEQIDDVGFRDGSHQVFLNPGVRYAITQREDVEWVVGVSVPIGLTSDTPDIGVFAYMSVEHDFRKPRKNGNGKQNGNGEKDANGAKNGSGS